MCVCPQCLTFPARPGHDLVSCVSRLGFVLLTDPVPLLSRETFDTSKQREDSFQELGPRSPLLGDPSTLLRGGHTINLWRTAGALNLGGMRTPSFSVFVQIRWPVS